MNAPLINRPRLNDGLQTWTEHWALFNGVLMCVQCGAWQYPSGADLPFSHAENCTLHQDGRQRPWQALMDLLDELPTMSGRFAGAARLEANAMLAPLNLPIDLYTQACKLLYAIGNARSHNDLRSAADRAEGFVLGVNTLRALNLGDSECLCLAFDHAEQVQQSELGMIHQGMVHCAARAATERVRD